VPLAVLSFPILAQVPKGAADNAALRYWNAFAQMKDQTLSDVQSKQLEKIAAGNAPWDEVAFGKLVDENGAAIETMVRGTALPYCAWGLDADLAEAAPTPQVGRGLALARLNVLSAARLAAKGRSHEAADHLIAGIRFSRDLGTGMPLIGILAGKSALNSDLNVVLSLSRSGQLSSEDRRRIVGVVRGLSSDVFDWSSALQLEAAGLRSVLMRLQASNDPAKLLASWGINGPELKHPRPTQEDIRQVDDILARAAHLFRQPASSTSAEIAQLDSRIANLKSVASGVTPSLQHVNDDRKEVEELRQKVLGAF
jgi:hypothetical protein